ESDFPRTFVFRLNDFVSQAFMAGYSGTPDPLEQETRLHLGFIPKCATNLSGLQFGGLLYGESTCGLAASGSGLLVYSPKMYAYGLSKYLVDINVSLLSGNRAFNELLTLDTVEIAIIKLDDNPMNNTDSLSIEFPEEININGALAVKGSGALAGIPTSATVGSNTINLGRRSVNLSVAASDVNSTANNGKNDTITYLIPILYTASAFVAPTHSIDASLNSPVKFADHCPSQPASVGSGKEEIAILTGVENPKAICYNGTDSITINTIGFNGGFYLDKDLTQLYQAAGKSSILHTPSAVGDTTFYVDAMINGTSYGYVPVRFSVRQPATASVNTTTFTILDTADAIIVPVTVHADTSSKIRYIHTYNMTPLLADTLHFDVPQGVANFNWNLISPTIREPI
ncbi:hypothetical protein LJB75_00920, partial [Bacteroidales bacterium OttesenSCG-928-L19]|nr:hypothetical protein [Bacteroidales bacterium OttesenSCG-928-L19]